jgi:serine/threonine-protein kinase
VPVELQPGQLLAGKYRIDRTIGRGGMGFVVAAEHEQLGERVAIKVLLPEVVGKAEVVARFLQEARATVKIRSEHVVRVKDVGEFEDGSPYIVMEYLEGGDLASLLAAGRLATQEVIDYVLQASEALAEAHKAGIVHRDLKPANLFVTRRADGSPLIKVLDFGISKAMDSDAALTRTSAFMGSPHYAPPEQLLSAKNADARSDIWALGVILYEALGGRVPFTGESFLEVATRVMHETPTDLAALQPDLSTGLCAVVMKCLEKQPASRYGDIAALARALAPFAPGSALSALRISKVMGEGDSTAAAAFAPTELPGVATMAHAATLPAAGGLAEVGTAPGHALSLAPAKGKRTAWVVLGVGAVVAAGSAWLAVAPPKAGIGAPVVPDSVSAAVPASVSTQRAIAAGPPGEATPDVAPGVPTASATPVASSSVSASAAVAPTASLTPKRPPAVQTTARATAAPGRPAAPPEAPPRRTTLETHTKD